MNPLEAYLIVSGLLFCIGLGGVLTRRHAIVVLMGIELMLNAANLNLVAFWRYGINSAPETGYIFVLFSIAVAAAESAVGLALVVAIYRHYKSAQLEDYNRLNG